MPPRIRLPIRITPLPIPQPGNIAFSPLVLRSTFTTSISRLAGDKDDAPMAVSGEEAVEDLEKLAKQDYKDWLSGPGRNFKRPLYNEMNYLSSYDPKTWQRRGSDRDKMNTPFPLNPTFRSTPVLSEELKEEIYKRAVDSGKSVRSVSAELGVSLERVGAVVRLKEVERKWQREGKHLATYLTKALHNMLPVTPLVKPDTGQFQPVHESTQEMPSHPFSHRQAFIPVSESREYTRSDAGKEFGLPPTEEAVPHPESILRQKQRLGLINDNDLADMRRELDRLEMVKKVEEEKKKRQKEANKTVVVKGRWKWVLKGATTGRVGFRYGVPHQDRKKGQVKIPTRVI